MPRRKKQDGSYVKKQRSSQNLLQNCTLSEQLQAVTTNVDLQATWELHYVSYFLRVFKKLFHLKKAYTAELLEKELNYDAIHVQFGEEIARVVEYLTGERDLGATSWEPALEEHMCKDAIHPNILKGTNFNALDPEQRLQLLKIVVDLIRDIKEEDICEFGRNLKSKSLRFKAVGRDKDDNKYWTFGSSRLFRELSKPTSKRFEPVCTTPNEWEGFILTLRPSPHKNERELHKSLKHVWGKIKDHIQLAQLKMKGQLELSQMAVKEHFELKRHAEAIEALESNLEKPKMTNIGNVKKTTKPRINDGFVSPVLGNSHILPKGPEKGLFVKKNKTKQKMRTQENDFMKPGKAKAKLSRSDSSSSSSDGPVTKKLKLNDDKKCKSAGSSSKTDEDEEPPIPEELRRKIEMDDPGIDLSVFKPLGKRKCVLKLEERKGKTWYEADDDASEEELHAEEYPKPVEPEAKKKKRKKAKTPPIMPAEPPVINMAPLPPFKSYVFSTALANRGAYEVIIKGKYNTVIEYHQAQKWPKPYLQHRIHCEPFVPEELKNETTLNSPDSGPSHSLSEEEEKKPKKPLKKKPRKKPQRKISDASISASTSSPASVTTRESIELRSEREAFSSGRDTGHSDHESSGSDHDHMPWENEVFTSKRDKTRIDRSHIFKDDLVIKREPSLKDWGKMPKFGIDSQDYDEYQKYLYNNNRKTGPDSRAFSPTKKSNYSGPKKLQNSRIPTKGQKKQNFSNPRPSPLNQPTKLQHIPDQLSEDDDEEEDEEEESGTSENEEMNGEYDKESKGDQYVPRSPVEAEIEDAKSPTEQLLERHISPAVSKLQAAEASSQGKNVDKDRQADLSRSISPQNRVSQQAASVISNSKNSSMPLRLSTPSDVLSGSPRNSPQLSPFASYRGRPATYPAEIVNMKSATVSSPRRSTEKERYSDVDSARVPENDMRSSDNVVEVPHNEGTNSSMQCPTTLPFGSRASPPQQNHPTLPAPDPKRPKPVHIPQMSPHPNEVSSVIQRPNPSPSSSVDNLCSPAIPMHQMQSPSIPVKPPASSPIVIHDTVNGNARSVSPTSPASVSIAPGQYASGVHSIISPVITNHVHKSPPISRNSPSMQASSGFSCAVQRPVSPIQPNNSLQRMQAMHASQADHNIQAALYQRHRIPQLPASLKTGVRGTPSILDDAKRIPGMIYNQQARAYQAMQHAMPKELSHRAFAPTGQESGHSFHGISPHSSQETPRTIHAPPHGVPESLKSHLAMPRSTPGDSSRSLLSLAHNNEEQARTFLAMSHGVQEAARSHHGIPRGAQSSPRSHISLPNHSQDASRTILGLTQSAQEAARNVLGAAHVAQESSSRVHHSTAHSAQESSRSHHGLAINAQELSRSHHPFAHPMHDQSRYPPGMTHPFHHGLNRTLHESPHARSLHEVSHSVRPGVHGHSFQQGFRSLNESPVGKSPPTQSLFQHAHGREFPSPSTGSKAYPSPLMERALIEQQSRILEHQQQVRLMEQQQSKKSFSVESLTSSSEASDRSKGQCLNGQPSTPSALSRAGYSASQRSHMFGHIPGYPRGPSSDFLKLPAHVQQMYSARGLSPYMNFQHFKG